MATRVWDYPQLADADDLTRRLPTWQGVRCIVLVPDAKGLDRLRRARAASREA